MAVAGGFAPVAPGAVPVPMGAPQVVDYNVVRMQKFQALAGRFEIRPDFCERLRALEGFEIVILADDSGSMCTPVDAASSGPFEPRMTRWDELREGVKIMVEIGSCLDPSGVDLYFLNRPSPFTNISSADQVAPAFGPPPSGGTPLVATLRKIFADKAAQLKEKKMLLVIATDGEPSEGTNAFTAAIRTRPGNVFVSILACTSDDGAVGYLDALDRGVPNVDVSDDYHSERRQVLKAQGSAFRFSYGDYIVKSLLAPVDRYFDSLDERSVAGGCCTVV